MWWHSNQSFRQCFWTNWPVSVKAVVQQLWKPTFLRVFLNHMWLGKWKQKENKNKNKNIQPEQDPRETTEQVIHRWPPPGKLSNSFFFFAWTLVHPAEEQMPLVPLSFFTVLSWTYAFFPISPMLMESALAARWKLRASFVNVRELLWHELHLLSLSWKAQPDPPGQRGKLYSSFESMSLFKEAFLPWAHVPAGSFLQGLSWKMGPQGQAQKYCKIFPLFLWKTALTRTYSDSLCSQGLQKPARSGFLTRFFLFVCLIQKCTFISRTVSHLLEHQQSCASAEGI